MDASPRPQGLYDGLHEHDACGVAFVATLTGQASNDIVAKGLTALRNLDHRGASGAEPDSGDGAGILMQVPDAFLRDVVDFELPYAGAYAVGSGDSFLAGLLVGLEAGAELRVALALAAAAGSANTRRPGAALFDEAAVAAARRRIRIREEMVAR